MTLQALQLALPLLTALAVRHTPSGDANAVATKAFHMDAFLQGRQSLKNIHAETGTTGGDGHLLSDLSRATLEKCENLDAEPGDLQMKLKELCQKTDSANIVSEMLKLVDDASVARWLCGLTTVNEIGQCQEAGRLILGGLQTAMQAKDKEKMLGTLQAYAVKIAVIFVPLPPPLGVIVEKGANLALSRLAKDAESHLETLETKMGALMRKTLSEDLLRLATAQARAADEQIQEMLTLDTLLNDMVAKSSTVGSEAFASAMAKVTSFNRWAIIEHDLATSTEVLRPPDEMHNLEERTHFARLMATHLEMYIIVLSQMHRTTSGTARGNEFQDTLTRKAQRMARLLLPDLVLLHGSTRFTNSSHILESVKTWGRSPLLSQWSSKCHTSDPSPRERLCCDLQNSEDQFHFEFLVSCLWLPLLDHTNESTFASPWEATVTSTTDACMMLPDWRVRQAETPFQPFPISRLASCDGDEVLEGLEQHWGQRRFFGDVEEIRYTCGQHWKSRDITLLPLTFETDGLCLEYVRLFRSDVVAVLSSVQFGSPRNKQFSEIQSSSCRLAYRSSATSYGPSERIQSTGTPKGTICDHCHWSKPDHCAYISPLQRFLPETPYISPEMLGYGHGPA